jgi:hypothetical protein
VTVTRDFAAENTTRYTKENVDQLNDASGQYFVEMGLFCFISFVLIANAFSMSCRPNAKNEQMIRTSAKGH